MLKHLSPTRLGLVGLAAVLFLAACGAQPAQSWPGLGVQDDLVYVASSQQVHAIRLADGKQAWAFPPAPSNTTGLFYADPGISPNVLVVGSEGPANSFSGVLFGLDPATGQQVWCLAFDRKGAERENCPQAPSAQRSGFLGIRAPTDNRIIGGIVVADDFAYLGVANGRVYAVNVANGSVKWFFDTDEAVWAAPTVTGDAVYVASFDHFVYALTRDRGQLIWKRDVGAAAAGSPAVVDGTVYAGTFGNTMYALEAETGAEKWTITTHHWVWGGPVTHNGVLYFTDLSGTVWALDAQRGRELWQRDLTTEADDLVRAAPGLTAEALYIGTKSGTLYALDLDTGITRWQAEVGGQLLATPLVADDLVLAAPYLGDNLLAAYTTSGALKWAFAPSK